MKLAEDMKPSIGSKSTELEQDLKLGTDPNNAIVDREPLGWNKPISQV